MLDSGNDEGADAVRITLQATVLRKKGEKSVPCCTTTMTMDEILDQPLLTTPSLQAFEWWEGKRLLYNFIVGGYGTFCTLKYFSEMTLIIPSFPTPIPTR